MKTTDLAKQDHKTPEYVAKFGISAVPAFEDLRP